MFKLNLRITYIILIPMFLFCCQTIHNKKETIPIRIIDTSYHFDGGTIEIWYFTQTGDIVKLYVDNRKIPKSAPRVADSGRIYLDKYPDNINYLKDNEKLLQVIKDLRVWLNKNLSVYSTNTCENYEIEINDKLIKAGLKNCTYSSVLTNISDINKAISLISKKYPEIYKLAEQSASD